jgi:folate-dependent phosphoribosylglycinamide formyltransferase PurN
MNSLRIGLLVSGGLGYDMLKHCYNQFNVKTVFTDANSSFIIGFVKEYNIPYFIGNPRNGRAFDFISSNKIDLLLSINYIFIIEKDLINWPQIAAVNFHGSLLPKYRGRTPHIWAIINNEKETGVSAHLITEGCDEGDIIEQVKIPIENDETGADILNKYASKKSIKETTKRLKLFQSLLYSPKYFADIFPEPINEFLLIIKLRLLDNVSRALNVAAIIK